MRIYYAHCQSIYGTAQEARDVKMLERFGFEVINPNSPGINKQCEQTRNDFNALRHRDTPALEAREQTLTQMRRAELMPFRDAGEAIMRLIFEEIVRGCDALAFRAFPDGTVPAGVHKEIRWAHEANKPVLELPSFAIRRILSVEDTRAYLREIGQR